MLRNLILHFQEDSYIHRPLDSFLRLYNEHRTRDASVLPQLNYNHLVGERACELSAYIVARSPTLITLRCSRPGYDVTDPIKRLHFAFLDAAPRHPRLENVTIEQMPDDIERNLALVLFGHEDRQAVVLSRRMSEAISGASWLAGVTKIAPPPLFQPVEAWEQLNK
jgi:hypothetical protein